MLAARGELAMRRSLACFALGLSIVTLIAPGLRAQAIHGRDGITLPAPPAAEAIPVTDDYFGIKLVDSYRWLEDAKNPQTQAFIEAQNSYTDRYMRQARMRPDVVDDLDALEHVSRWGVPIERGGNLFFKKRLAGEEQGSIYVRRAGVQKAAKPSPNIKTAAKAAPQVIKDERLIDPARLSRDPNTSVELADVSRDGSLIAFQMRGGGADETNLRVFDVKSGKMLEDELPAGLYRSVSFTPDGKGIFYTRQDRQGTLLWQHTLGERPTRDTLLFGREFHGEELGPIDLFTASVTDDGRYLVVHITRGVPAKREDIVFRDLTKASAPFEDLVWGTDARFSAVWAGSGKSAWIVKTDYKAPNGRILLADPGILPDSWTTLVAEGPDPLEDFSVVGEKLYLLRMKDVQSTLTAYAWNGKEVGPIQLDGIGKATTPAGRSTDRYGYFTFESILVPPTLFRLDTLTGQREVFAQPHVPFDPSQYELKQVFYTSKDGTRVPMFIAGRKGLKQDGSERLLMTGYGGFNVSILPQWSAANAWWLSQGGWFAQPNLRGGGEYGEHWHEQGMLEHKQNVFDDWFAAAEYLIAQKYTYHLAITGRSNGGLLMGASITQRPELFAAVVCGYPLLDMLRYQKFRQGPQWTTEYGQADKETQFRFLLHYSPYQNIKPGADYPAVFFFTGESDSRVDPLHARKMTALLQASSTSGRPVLLHDSLSGGHSSGVSVAQQIQDDADQLTFLWTETGNPADSRVSK
jgi:prolyl oligopeptidase